MASRDQVEPAGRRPDGADGTILGLSPTQLLVVTAIVFLVGLASWQFIGEFLFWAIWQLAVYYAILAVVGALLYWVLFIVGGNDDG